MDVIIPDTSAFPDPTVDEYVDSIERDGRIGAAQTIRGELWTLRAEVERLTAERDALARRMRVVEYVAVVSDQAGYHLAIYQDCPHRKKVVDALAWTRLLRGDDSSTPVEWSYPNIPELLDAAADALEKAGLMEVGNV